MTAASGAGNADGATKRLPTALIPQAESPHILLRLVNLIASGERPTPEILNIHQRQVAYYVKAGQILGLLDQDHRLTSRGEFLVLRSADEHLAALATIFSETELAKSLTAWQGVRSVYDLDPTRVDEFLRERTMLTGTTTGRRATTLRKWICAFRRVRPADVPRDVPATDAPPRRPPKADGARSTVPLSLRDSTLLACRLSQTRRHLLGALACAEPAALLEVSRERRDHCAAWEQAEERLRSTTARMQEELDPHRLRVLRRKLAHQAEQLELHGTQLRKAAEASRDPSVQELVVEEHNLAARLCVANQRLVADTARRSRPAWLTVDDLTQEANIGLMHAVDRFDYRRGSTFATYATYWIKQTIGRALQNSDAVIRLPVHMHERVQKIKKARSSFKEKNGRDPSADELSALTELPLTQVVKTLKVIGDRVTEKAIALESSVGDEDDRAQLKDQISAETPSPLDFVLGDEGREAIRAVIDSLEKPKERAIIKMRFGIEHPREHTLEDIAKVFKVTRERIRQIEKKVMGKLRKRGLNQGLRELFGHIIDGALSKPAEEDEV